MPPPRRPMPPKPPKSISGSVNRIVYTRVLARCADSMAPIRVVRLPLSSPSLRRIRAFRPLCLRMISSAPRKTES